MRLKSFQSEAVRGKKLEEYLGEVVLLTVTETERELEEKRVVRPKVYSISEAHCSK